MTFKALFSLEGILIVLYLKFSLYVCQCLDAKRSNDAHTRGSLHLYKQLDEYYMV